jgi:scyllo-inositol 2-dehydrogenase (NADP+)
MNKIINVGIIGFGYASATFHVPLIQSIDGLRLVAIASSAPHKVKAALPGMRVETAPQALIERPDIDLLVIPTPNETHYQLASQGLAAGKHVVVDKPFTVTLDEARGLKAEAKAAGRVLSVFHNRRWDSDFLTLKQVIESGQLGRIVHFESHFDRFRPQVKARWREQQGPGAGLWFDLGPHLLDQAVQLFGSPDSIQLDTAIQRDGALVDDWFHALLGYGSMRVVLHAGALVPEPAARFTVHGERGSFIKHGLDPQEDQLKLGKKPSSLGWGLDPVSAELVLWEGTVSSRRPLPCQQGDYPAYYRGVRDAIRGEGADPVTPDQAIQVMALIEAGVRSAAAHRQVEAMRA